MASFADISIRFSADLKKFSSEMQNAQREMKKFGGQLKNVGAGLSAAITLPLLGLGALAVKTAADFETLETGLVTAMEGSESAAKSAFDQITKFAASTPFQVDQVANAFIKLKNLGLDPSERALNSYGNTASAMGKSLNQVIEAVADAATGEFERLKEFGIKSKQQGDQVVFTFKGVETAVKKDAASIQKYLLNIGETDFAGGMERQSRTFQGRISTLKDNLALLGREFGNIILDYINPFVDKIGAIAKSFQNLSPETKKLIVQVGALAAAVGPLLVTIGYLSANVIPGLITAFAAVRTAFTALTATIAANPIGALVTVLGLAAAAFIVFGNSSEKAVKQQTILEQVSEEAAKSIASEKAKLEELLFIARDEQVSKEQRLKAIQELNKLSPKYLGNLTLEKINTDEARKAIDLYNESLLKTAKVKAAQERLTKIQAEIIDAELSASKSRNRLLTDEAFQRRIAAVAQQKGITTEQAQKELQDALNIGSSLRQKNLKEEAAALLEIIKANDLFNESLLSTNAGLGDGKVQKVSTVNTITTVGGQGIDAQNEKLREQIAILEAARSQYSETSAEYKYLSDQIAFHSETIKNSINGIVGEGVGFTQFDAKAFQMGERMKWLAEMGSELGSAMGATFEDFTGSMLNSLNLADHGFQGFIKSLGKTINKLISQMLASALAQSISGATASGASTGPAAVFTTPAFIASAIAGVFAAFAAIPKFADGGVVFGPTFGMMGEYAGARNNPEVIAPLNKLKEMIEPSGINAIDLGLGTRIKGTDLEIIIERVVQRNSRLR